MNSSSTQQSLPVPRKQLVSKNQMDEIIAQLGEQIADRYSQQRLVMVPVLTGALRFTSELIAHLETIALEIEPVMVQSYVGTQSTEAKLNTLRLQSSQVAGSHVLIVDDIYDTGQTLWKLTEYLHTLKPASVSHAVLLQKTGRQDPRYRLTPEFIGVNIPDEFVVGMGLDYRGFYRNLSSISVLEDEERAFVDQLLA